MASNTVKCVNCNVVINELLAFLRNVMDFMDEESIHQLCNSAFSEADVLKAKILLFESLPTAKKMPKRRAEGKKKLSRDLDDIIALMKTTDSDLTPIFVAKDLHKLPPVTFDHVDVTRLLKDILILKNQINAIEEKSVTTDQFDQLKKQVENLKHASILDSNPAENNFVNLKRGACLQNSLSFNSGPIGLQYMPINQLSQTADFKTVNGRVATPRQSSFTTDGEANFVSFLQRDTTVEPDLVDVEAVQSGGCIGARGSETTCASSRPTVGEKLVPTTNDIAVTASDILTFDSDSKQPTDTVSCNNNNINAPRPTHLSSSSSRINMVLNTNVNREGTETDSEWQIVRRKVSKTYKLIGQKGRASIAPESKFRAADVKIPLFISNVNKNTTESDIIKYIKDKTDENISLKQINMRKTQKYNAFKVYVSKQKVDMFLDDEFWPDGITFRRFVHFKYRTVSSGVKVS